jgi:purine-binding chemotaxis protein CheW
MPDEKSGRRNDEDDFEFDEEEDSMKSLYLTFCVGDEDFGIETAYVTEIVGMQHITEVPDMPDYVKGVINLRGQVIPVVDLRTRFKLSFKEYCDRTCIVVVNINETAVGLIVDTVNEVVSIPEAQISPPPKISESAARRYIRGMGKINEDVKILLDLRELFRNSEMGFCGDFGDEKLTNEKNCKEEDKK